MMKTYRIVQVNCSIVQNFQELPFSIIIALLIDASDQFLITMSVFSSDAVHCIMRLIRVFGIYFIGKLKYLIYNIQTTL